MGGGEDTDFPSGDFRLEREIRERERDQREREREELNLK